MIQCGIVFHARRFAMVINAKSASEPVSGRLLGAPMTPAAEVHYEDRANRWSLLESTNPSRFSSMELEPHSELGHLARILAVLAHHQPKP